CVRVAAVELVDLLLLARRDAADLVEQGALQFLVGDLDAGLLADVSQDEAETDAALCKALVLVASLDLGGPFVSEGAASASEVVVDLGPDVVELSVDQLRRSLELVGLIQRVEQLALGLLAGNRAVLALDLALHDFAELLEALKTELLGDFVVQLELGRLGDSLHLDVESGFLASEMSGRVLLREGNRDDLLFAGLEPDQLVLEARDELVGAQDEVGILGSAALEGLTIDLAEVVEGDLVALFGLALLFLVGARGIRDLLDVLVHFLFR